MSVLMLAARKSENVQFQAAELLFDEDVFAPTRCLEFFSAFGALPERFELSRAESGGSWKVRIEMRKNAQSERVLAKASVLIGLLKMEVIDLH